MYFRPLAFALVLGMAAACTSESAQHATPTARDVTPSAVTSAAPGMTRPADGSRPGVFLLGWSDPGPNASGMFRPIDPQTGLDLAGFVPLEIRYAGEFSASPDGRTLVWMFVRNGRAPDSGLATIDLATWTMRDHAKFTGMQGGFAWTPDSRSVYYHQLKYYHQLAGGYGRGHEIERLDVSTGAIEALGQVPFLIATRMTLGPDAAHLYFLGLNSSDPRGDLLAGDPFLAAFDLRTGETTTVALPGMFLGQVKDPGPEGAWAAYQLGLAITVDGSLAYVTDSIRERLVVIDLLEMRIRDDRSVAKLAPAWKRGLSWLRGQLVTSTHAKGGEVYSSSARLSRDGRYLFVTGTRDESCPGRPGPCVQQRPAGLRVIDTQSLEVVLRADGIGTTVVSPDGRLLVGFSRWWEVPRGGGATIERGSGLQFFDTVTLKRVAHVKPGDPVEDAVFDPADRHMIALSPRSGLDVIDLRSLQIVHSRHDFNARAARLFSTAARTQ